MGRASAQQDEAPPLTDEWQGYRLKKGELPKLVKNDYFTLQSKNIH